MAWDKKDKEETPDEPDTEPTDEAYTPPDSGSDLSASFDADSSGTMTDPGVQVSPNIPFAIAELLTNLIVRRVNVKVNDDDQGFRDAVSNKVSNLSVQKFAKDGYIFGVMVEITAEEAQLLLDAQQQ